MIERDEYPCFLKILMFFLLLLLFLIFPLRVSAEGENQYITIVNPVRISRYTQNPKESIAAQYKVISERELPATWLLTYDALSNEGVQSVIKKMDSEQELGVFLEVTPGFAQAAGVDYHNTGFWHHATSVFLSGYTQGERIKLVDTIFEDFKNKFGFYPSSVGAWWTDAFSLSWAKDKYGITANLGLADQFSTDGYQVWGQYWSMPFYPSKYHAGVPAQSEDVKLDVVTIQWAPRDPLNGYESSVYSTQDYPNLGLSNDYFEKLIRLYAGKDADGFGQITVGLEGDLNPDNYGNQFVKQMDVVSSLRGDGFSVVTMSDFAKWYRSSFPQLSSSNIIETDDFLGKKYKVFWYQSQNYRLGMVYDYEKQKAKVFDIRVYDKDLIEPYYISPNRDFHLFINLPAVLDRASFYKDEWELSLGELKEVQPGDAELTLKFEEGEFKMSAPSFSINGDFEIPSIVSSNDLIKIDKDYRGAVFVPNTDFFTNPDGVLIRALTLEGTHFLNQKKVILSLVFAILLFVLLLFVILVSRLSTRLKVFGIVLPTLIIVVFLTYWYKLFSVSYLIPQEEMLALSRLSVLPQGRVVIFDGECLQCKWHTKNRPAIFGNKRGYVSKYSKKPVVYNSSVFLASTREGARDEFKKLQARYIYVVRFEDYKEQVPFSPGDLGIEKIYENANAQIWQRKE